MATKSTEQELRQARLNKLDKLSKAGIDPYPSQIKRTHTNQEAQDSFAELSQSEKSLTLVGRIRSWRSHGGSVFAHLEDGTTQIQIYFRKDVLSEELFEQLNLMDIGDFIQATGTLFETKMGEKTLLTQSYNILAKSIKPLPNAWYGLKDIETRYRKRYLDFVLNPEVKDKIVKRSIITTTIREFLVKQGFIEIENPILELAASGALAKPFETHINAFDLDMYLRICIGELWQKRSLVGGFEKVFELGRAFRNEGVDFEHNPEFTMLEYYWAYASLEDNMKLHEELFSLLADRLFGQMTFECQGKSIDLTPPYPRKTFRQAVLEYSQIDIEDYPTAQSLHPLLKKMNIDFDPSQGHGNLLDELYKNTTRPKLIQPVFITEYPAELKPLAKLKDEQGKYVDIFQLLINGMEISNSYNELNDPIDQRQRFEQQAQLKAAGDDEAMQYDQDYVEALEYGMPPATGTGIGIDRLTALLTDSHHLREIIAYPLMKPLAVKQKGRKILKGKPTDWTDKNILEQDQIVLGRIKTITDHPQADTLKICRVDIGAKELQIISNCSNLKENMLVAVALPGTTVFDWQGEGTTHMIERSELRGQTSEAMMCASEEIGIHVPEDQREPLFEVPATDKPLGTPIRDILNTPLTRGARGVDQTSDPSLDPTEEPRITREAAMKLLHKHIKTESTIKHVLAAEAAMRAYARKYGANEDLWGVAGLLHDIAWEIDYDKHPEIGAQMLADLGVNELIVHAVKAHDPDLEPCQTQMDKILLASEELTGLITAYAHILPSKKLADVKAKSVLKKFKVKQFAANIHREDIIKGAELAGLDMQEHIDTLVKALQEISDDLGL